MSSHNTGAAKDFHSATRLSYINLATKPPLFKDYSGAEAVSLPSEFPSPDSPALSAVHGGSPVSQSLDLAHLAQLLYYSAGVIRKRDLPTAGQVHYRAASSAGALYPTEVYLVCRDLPGLRAGVYHFAPDKFRLHLLRRGDFRALLARAAAMDSQAQLPPAILVLTTVFWRSAWKYRARGYRYCFWDCGAILSNFLATSSAVGIPARLLTGFVDAAVNRLIGVDGVRESAICLVAAGLPDPGPATGPPTGLGPSMPEASGIATDEITYPEVRRLHTESFLHSPDRVQLWRASPAQPPPPTPPAPLPGPTPARPSAGLGDVIRRRGSTRRFDQQPVSSGHLTAILDASISAISADFLGPGFHSLLETYLVLNNVEGLSSGAYHFPPPPRSKPELLKAGDFRQEAGHLCFEQALGADAAAVVFLMADLDRLLARFGNRGYRAAQLQAGIVGGRLYLCADSLGLGASGTTFYDDDVTGFFSPHAAGKSCMFVIAIGVPSNRNRVRPFRSRVGVVLDALARGAQKRSDPAS